MLTTFHSALQSNRNSKPWNAFAGDFHVVVLISSNGVEGKGSVGEYLTDVCVEMSQNHFLPACISVCI